MIDDIKEIQQALIHFRKDRDWEQFHDSKNLAIALSIEAAELNQLFLWKSGDEAERVSIDRIKEELADVLSYAFLLAIKHNFDVKDIIFEKIQKNSLKYPISKAKGRNDKYNEL